MVEQLPLQGTSAAAAASGGSQRRQQQQQQQQHSQDVRKAARIADATSKIEGFSQRIYMLKTAVGEDTVGHLKHAVEAGSSSSGRRCPTRRGRNNRLTCYIITAAVATTTPAHLNENRNLMLTKRRNVRLISV